MSTTDFHAMRQAMVASQLRTSAVSDPRVIAAMAAVAREAFVPAERAALAYVDRAIPLGQARALNAPLATGLLLNALDLRHGESVLIVGAATGYAAALAAELGAEVTALEEDGALLAHARRVLADAARVTLVQGPLAAGWAGRAPYAAILVDGAIESVPAALAAQLAEGGRMAAALAERGVTRIAAGRKSGGALALTDFADAAAVPLPGFATPRGFVF